MSAPRLVLVLGDQLDPAVAALRAADRSRDVVVMAEVMGEASYVPHHPKKIAFLFSAMRHFAEALRQEGWTVAYGRLDHDATAGSIGAELLRRAEETGAREVIATEPGEWRLIAQLEDLPLPVRMLPDDRFLCSHEDFARWAEGRKSLRMEYFYREMRRRHDMMMEGDKPAGGHWNYDQDNRKPASADMLRQGPPRFEPDAITSEVLALVGERFADNFGDLEPFWFAVTPTQAREALDHFVAHRLAEFGPYQDAMLEGDPFLGHAVIGLYLNAGLLDPRTVCRAAEKAWRAGRVPINSAEGFIRQVLGWREFVRGIYFREGPDYVRRNALNHQRGLPAMYWGGETRMACMAAAIGQTRTEAYAHHIQRLMVTGNFALLAGIKPWEVHEWYLAVYADAYEWVEAPNVIGMSQFADGGVVGSKPYAASGAYIDRMSDYCGGCHYRVKEKVGDRACPFNLLYWHFLIRHRERLAGNPRMAQMYRTWDRMAEDRRDTVLADADRLLERLSAGAVV
ncbi:MAG: cryptochrome/photolyase family protein [Alkalilacustris sp.]